MVDIIDKNVHDFDYLLILDSECNLTIKGAVELMEIIEFSVVIYDL